MSQSDVPGTRFFGVIALGLGMINKDQLSECLEVQKESSIRRRIGAIMRARGYLTEEQVREVLSSQGKTLEDTRQIASREEKALLLGEILVDLGHLDRQVLKDIVKKYRLLCSQGENLRLTRLLISMGKVTRSQIEEALSVLAREIK